MYCFLCSLSKVNLHSRIWGQPILVKNIRKLWIDIFDFESWLVDEATLSRFAALNQNESKISITVHINYH